MMIHDVLHRKENEMKRIIAISAVVIIGTTATLLTSCQRDQLSKSDPAAGLNGSFETTRDGYPVNWAFFPNPESNTSFQAVLDSENVVDGKHSLKLIVKQNDKTTGFRSRRIPVQSGKKYRLAMLVKTDGCSLKVNRIVQDISGKKNLRSNIIVNTEKRPSAKWENYEETLSVAEGESYLLLIFLIDGTGTLWCDNVQLEEIK